MFECTADTGTAMRFVIDPAETDATGKGRILVTYDGATYDGVSAGDRGPFQFGNDAHHFALIIEGGAGAAGLKAQLHHATGSASTLIPLTCETDF